MTVPVGRVRRANGAPVRADGRHVLYWMIAARRTSWSFALQRAVEHAAALGRPLLVLEALRKMSVKEYLAKYDPRASGSRSTS